MVHDAKQESEDKCAVFDKQNPPFMAQERESTPSKAAKPRQTEELQPQDHLAVIFGSLLYPSFE